MLEKLFCKLALLYALFHFVTKVRKTSNAQKLIFFPLAYFMRTIIRIT
ncbi:hypothetical protein TPE_1388 [Treponema pedis str. T A4]|uniref:Uncharacterized protein n=1 Tax=Treponema pedis str. T A4 TaxID=1291379 RepID=S5ZZU8_9SPIR|nr:hypothetical protein TPE_1388 [Treponema pedis str. T A4]